MTTLRMAQVDVPEGVIDLGIGQPDDSVYPVEAFRRAASVVFAEGSSIEHYQYGAEYGDGRHRIALGRFLSQAYGFPVDPELLFTTNGNSQALDMVCTVYSRPGDVVVVEEPSYFLAHGIFADHGLEVVGVPIDEDGLDPDRVDSELTRLAREGRRVPFIYTIPVFHNPTGVTLGEQKRARLVEVAADHGVLVVADEVYHLLPTDHAVPLPPAMSRWIDTGAVLSLGTFSKILSPGLRLGWVHGSAERVAALADSGLVVSGGGLNPIPSRLVTEVIASGDLDANITSLCREYDKRVTVMHQALEAHMPDGVRWMRPRGGYFFWLEVPEGVDASRVRAAAREEEVDFREGSLFSAVGSLDRYLRLSFAYYREPDIFEGVVRLGRALRSISR